MEVLDEYFKKKVDGVIIFELRGNATVLEKFMRSGMPITAVDYRMKEIKADSVNVGGAYSAMRYLHERGHRKILFIAERTSPPYSPCSYTALGVLWAVAEAGYRFRKTFPLSASTIYPLLRTPFHRSLQSCSPAGKWEL